MSEALVSVAADEALPDQKSHGATFDSTADQQTPPVSPQSPFSPSDSSAEQRIAELLVQLGEGVQADKAANLTKLEIARKYGPLLWELKELCPHGTFKVRLKERYPTFHYTTPNRWMYVAKNEEQVAAALDKYPDVPWGLKKMIDFLRGSWSPEAEEEEDRFDGDEDEYTGFVPSDLTEEPSQEASGEDDADEFATENDPEEIVDEEVGEEAETGILQFPPNTRPKQQTHQVVASKASTPKPNSPKPKEKAQPANRLTDYEVEVRLGFKLSVPSHLTADDIEAALKVGTNWAVELDTSFDNHVSEVMVRVSTVQPWDTPTETAR
jgi:hypothetical protein